MAKPETPKKGVKPRGSSYDPEVAAKICELLSDGVSLREICRMPGMPPWRNVYFWMERDQELAAHIARARELGYEAIAEECLVIANTPLLGKRTVYSSGGDDDDSVTVTEEDMLGHRKLQIETRLKLLAKWNPKRYGDRVQLAGDADNPIKIEAETQADKLINALLQNAELRKQSESR